MSFCDRYAEFARLFESDPNLGLPEQEILDAETRLGVRLPQALRDFYLTLGAWELNTVLNQLLAPSDLAFTDRHLVFYEEEEGNAVWAIPTANLEEPDPSVYQGLKEKRRLIWYEEELPCAAFLLQMTAWQTLVGGLGFASVATVSGRFKGPGPDWQELGTNGPMTIHTKPGAAFGVVYDEDEGVTSLHLGATSATALESAQEAFPSVPWEVIVDGVDE